MATGYSHRKKGAKELREINIKKGEKGGHVVSHHFESNGPQWHEPEIHVFGESEGPAMLEHVKKMMDVKEGKEMKGSHNAEEMKEDEQGPDEE